MKSLSIVAASLRYLIAFSAAAILAACSQPAGTTSTRSFEGSYKSPLTGADLKVKGNSSTTVPGVDDSEPQAKK